MIEHVSSKTEESATYCNMKVLSLKMKCAPSGVLLHHEALEARYDQRKLGASEASSLDSLGFL